MSGRRPDQLIASIGLLLMLAGAGAAQAQAPQRQYTSAEIQAGYRLYTSQCALCHGGNGDGIAGINLARGQFRRAASDDDIRRTISNGIAAFGMPAFTLAPAELNNLLAYIRSGFDLAGTPFRIGDAARGKAIYDGKGQCALCHRIAGSGALKAPDLTDIGLLRKPSAIARSLTDPTAAMAAINRSIRIVTSDGRAIRGRRLNEDTSTVQLIDDEGHLMSLQKSDIRDYQIASASDMPSYAGKLSDDEIADLLAYLLSLKG